MDKVILKNGLTNPENIDHVAWTCHKQFGGLECGNLQLSLECVLQVFADGVPDGKGYHINQEFIDILVRSVMADYYTKLFYRMIKLNPLRKVRAIDVACEGDVYDELYYRFNIAFNYQMTADVVPVEISDVSKYDSSNLAKVSKLFW